MERIRLLITAAWGKIRQHPFWSAIIMAIIFIVIVLSYQRFILGWQVWAPETGFGEYRVTKVDPTNNKPVEVDVYNRTWWDLLGIIFVPLAIAAGAAYLNHREKERELKEKEEEQELADARNQETVLQNYIDKMNELLLEKGLSKKRNVWELLSEKDLGKAWKDQQQAVRDIAQIRTVTVLRLLNSDRRNIVFQFLRDAELASFILESAQIVGIDLRQARLENFNLVGLNLINSNLSEANLTEANMMDAKLPKINLYDAEMTSVNLSGADLTEANLSETGLDWANLSDVSLGGSNLRDAVFFGANLRNAYLCLANLEGAYLSEANLSTSE